MSQKSKSIQDKMIDLDQLTAWFDSEDFVLEEAIDKFKQAELLATDIEKDLLNLKNDIRIIKKKFDSE